ncbi:transcription factor bHLH52 [Impatiens glandulifera]|uniref:transcription factor bHLH52 n=1 Tax=Impatiens glandulifera TaxID=253017 RepID=UPI001FB0F447|nr:transcription factor bHLH52 [Impatiens glandulifera]
MNTDNDFQALLVKEEVSRSFYQSPIIAGQSTADLVSMNYNIPSSPLHYSYPNAFMINDHEMMTDNYYFTKPMEYYHSPNPISSTVYDFNVTDSNIIDRSLVYLTGAKHPVRQPEEIKMYTSSLARNRRQKYSEKIRCLQKILPWDKKMNMATMLEEAYKYVKFLQAQVSILQSMPYNSSTCYSSSSSHVISPIPGDFYGGLGKLNRQQLLQVLVNSPVAQTLLYSRGCCVYSVEQLSLLREIEKAKANQKVMFDHDPPSFM